MAESELKEISVKLPDDALSKAAHRIAALESALRGVLLVVATYRKTAQFFADAYARACGKEVEFIDYTEESKAAIDLANKVLE